MNFIKPSIILSIALLISCKTIQKGVFTPLSYKTQAGWEIPYNIFYPDSYGNKNEKSPLFLWLHGAGERGNENTRQLIHIAPYVTSNEIMSKYPAVWVFPQCPKGEYWAPVDRKEWKITPGGEIEPSMVGVIELLDRILKNPKIDKDRIYVGGLSMGGFGTLDLLSRRPEIFAAALPICGGADLDRAENYLNVPIWIFHGAKDAVVSPQFSRDLVRRLEEKGAHPRYTEYPEGVHNVWNDAIKDPEVLEWIFNQKKVKNN